MALTNDLISEFIKVTNDKTEVKTESTHYGTIVEYEGSKYVRLDGSDLLTPILQTTDAENEERVVVMIKNHTAIVTGNLSSPSARTEAVQQIGNRITEAEILIADKVSTKEFDAQNGRIDNLISDNVLIKKQLVASEALIDELEADNIKINESLSAQQATIEEINAQKLSVTDADLKYATIEGLDATNADIHNLEADYGAFVDLTTKNFDAANAAIGELNTNKLSATDADLRYANIDFSNIGKAAMEYLYTTSGLIDNVVIGDATISGNLVGVTIKGDLIEGGTVVAEKLVIKGTDGLYYKLNTDGVKTETEQTEYNSLNGSVITAKSITATKISVDDLVAFDATIGGFNITEESIYSGVKSSVDNTTRGIYLDNDGQVAFGDSNNFLKFHKDENGIYKLAISADSIIFGTGKKSVEETVNEAIENANFGIQVVGGTFTQANCREGKSIHIFSEFGPKQDKTYGDPYPGGGGVNLIDISSCGAAGSDDRTITISGELITVVSSSVVYPQARLVWLPAEITLKAGTTYTIALTSPMDFVIRIGYVTVPAGSLSKTFTLNEDVTTDHIALDATEGQSINATFGICLRADNVAEYAPYANTPPIEGWTGLNAGACGENLFSGIENVIIQLSPTIATVTQNGNVVTLSTLNYADGFYLGHGAFRKGKKYTVSGNVIGSTNVRTYDITDMLSPTAYITPDADGNFIHTFIASSDDDALRIWVNKDVECVLTNFQIETGDLSSYTPYTGKTYALDFGDTIYGGRVDWNAGEMTVEWVKETLSGNEDIHAVNLGNSENVQQFNVSGAALGALCDGSEICSEYPFNSMTPTGNATGFCIYIPGLVPFGVPKAVLSRYGDISSGEKSAYDQAVKAYFADRLATGNPIQFSYKLAEPYTIQLTPVQLETLKGINTVYTDADGGRVEYGHDFVNVVNKVVTPTGYVFGEDGLLIDRPNTEMKTMITEDGMTVYKNDQPTLVVNNAGVDAVNLHATTYLLIGKNSRLEDWNTNRTACFWIGE